MLAAEFPNTLNGSADTITNALGPSGGEDDTSDLILAILLQMSQDISEVREDVVDLKTNQAVLQNDVSSLQRSSAVNSAKMSTLETSFEGILLLRKLKKKSEN